MKFVDVRKTGKSHGTRTQFKIAYVDMLYWNFIVIEAIIDPLYYVILIYYRINVISHYNPQLVRVSPKIVILATQTVPPQSNIPLVSSRLNTKHLRHLNSDYWKITGPQHSPSIWFTRPGKLTQLWKIIIFNG